MDIKKSVLLIIIDGFGLGEKSDGNAIFKARTPIIDKIFKENSYTELFASGKYVGLPEGQMGNSEVGHLNIGAGRVVYQDLTYINKCISDGSFYKNQEFAGLMETVKKNNSALHLMGLLSDGGVHSSMGHFFAVLRLAKKYDLKKVFLHVWTDGRDTAPKSAVKYINALENFMCENKIGTIKTVSGRYYAMDRDKNWDRTEFAFNLIFNAKGIKFENAAKAIESSYSEGITDEFIKPYVKNGYQGIKKNDVVLCLNFRSDRARQITEMFTSDSENFQRLRGFNVEKYYSLTSYDEKFENVDVIFKPRNIKNTLGEYVSRIGLKQLRVAETEKYAHVTFFLNGGVEEPNKGEDRVIVKSPNVKTYDLKPEMSAQAVTDEVLKGIQKGSYDLIIVNFANPDMVGHTGNMESTVKAVETVDNCILRLIKEIENKNVVAVITADHGNAEKMKDENGNVFTSHTTAKVPFAILGYKEKLKKGGSLCNIAPTILKILDLAKPDEMSSESLL